jgi:hypothetical protein
MRYDVRDFRERGVPEDDRSPGLVAAPVQSHIDGPVDVTPLASRHPFPPLTPVASRSPRNSSASLP